jgi:hypothetical protein
MDGFSFKNFQQKSKISWLKFLFVTGRYMPVKELFHQAIRSRAFVALWVVILLQAIILIAIVAFGANPHSSLSEVYVRFSSFAPAQYFRDNWMYLLNFILLGVVTAGLAGLISLKLLDIKGRSLSLLFLALMIVVLVVVTTLLTAALRVARISAGAL